MENNTTNPVTYARQRYFSEFVASMVVYVAVIFVRHWLLHGPMHHASESAQIAIALLPLIPVVFLFAAIVRLIRGTDELYRRVCVDSLALAGGATALIAVTYGLIEGERFPHVSAWWTYSVFMVVWLVAGFFVQRRYR